MSWLLAILIVITLACIIGIIVGLATDEEDMTVGCVRLLIIFGLFGWGLFGSLIKVKTITYPASNCQILKSKNSVLVIDEYDHPWKFDSHEDYTTIDSTTDFYYIADVNMYGGEVGRKLIYNK